MGTSIFSFVLVKSKEIVFYNVNKQKRFQLGFLLDNGQIKIGGFIYY